MNHRVALIEKHFSASSYLKLLPLSDDQLDLSSLELLDPRLPADWLQHLLNGESAERVLDLPESEADSQAEHLDALQARLEALYAKQEKIKKATGSHALHLGYPLIQFPANTDAKSLTAPLYLWNIRLEHNEEQPRQWSLHYNEQHRPHLNPVLHRYLKYRSNLDLLDLQVGLNGQKPLDSEALSQMSNKLIVQMGLEGQAKLALLKAEPLQDKWTALHWNAIIDVFQAESLEVLETEPVVAVQQSASPAPEHEWRQSFSGLRFNHEQEAALRQLTKGFDLRIEGLEQSGKTHFAIGSTLSLLGDMAQALVVAPEAKHFDQWEIKLEELGLSNLCLRLEDENADKAALLERLLALPKQLKKTPLYDEATYKIRLRNYREIIQQIDAAQEALEKGPFRDEDWPSAVGAFLHFHQQEGKQLLSRLLDEKRYSWSLEEYEQLMLCLEQHEPLYKQIDTLDHPLLALADNYFSAQALPVAKKMVQQKLHSYREQLRELYFGLLSFSENLKDELHFQYEDYTLNMRRYMQRLREHIKNATLRYGSDYESTGTLNKAKLRITGLFSKRSREVLEAKEEQQDRYEALLDYYETKRFFNANLPAYRKSWSPQDIYQLLDQLEKQLQAWQAEVEHRVEQRLRNLNPNAAFIRPEMRHQLEQLESEWNAFAEKVEQDGIWNKNISRRFELVEDQERYMGALQEELYQIYRGLSEFEAYYHWRRDWLMMSELEHHIIEALVALKPKSWEKAFRSWYLYYLLNDYYSLDLPQQELQVERLTKVAKEWRKLLVEKIQSDYQQLQQEHLKRLKSENRPVYDRLFKKSAQSSLAQLSIEEIIALQPQLFRHLFPIQLLSPSLAKRCWGRYNQVFALLVVEGAEQLEEPTTQPILGAAQQRLLLGKERPGAPASSIWSKSAQEGDYHRLTFEQQYVDSAETDSKTASVQPSAFAKEIQRALTPYVEDSRLEFLTDNPLGIHLIVHPLHTKAAPIAIVCDGFLNQLPRYAYERASMQSQAIGEQNYVLRLEWSAQWWRNYERAKRRLVAFILNWDKDFE